MDLRAESCCIVRCRRPRVGTGGALIDTARGSAGPVKLPSRSPTLSFYNKPARGRHFAAWSEPGLFAGDARAAFRGLR